MTTDVVAAIAGAVAPPACVGVDGRTAAGKTTFADELAQELARRHAEVARVRLDDFHRPPELRVDYYRDTFDLTAFRSAVESAVVVVADGVFLLRPELADLWDLVVWIEIERAESLRRGVARDAAWLGGEEEARLRYEARYVPAEDAYVAVVRPRERATFVVDNTDPACPRLSR